MASFSIDQLRALPDYAQTNRWDVTFVTLPAVGALGFAVSDELNFRCKTIEIPKATVQKFEVAIRGHKTFHAGGLDYGNSITLTFSETVDNTLFNFIKAWRELIWSTRQGQAFSKQDIEATILLTLRDNQDGARAKYTIYGCFLEDSDSGSLIGDSAAESQEISITLSFDFFADAPLSL